MDAYKWLNMCALQHSGPHITLVMSSSSPSIHTLETLRSGVEKKALILDCKHFYKKKKKENTI